MSETLTEQPTGARMEIVPGENKWEGIVLPFGVGASDGRAFDPTSLAWRDLPLVLYFQEKDEGLHTSPHNNVRPVGRILQFEVRREGLWAAGDFYDLTKITGAHADAVRMAMAMLEGGTGMVSVDALANQELRNGRPYYTDSEIIAVTMTGKQAFAGARVRAAAGLHVLTPVEAGALADVCCGCSEGTCPVSLSVVGSTSLPVASGAGSWDGPAAAGRILDWATSDDGEIEVTRASRGFFWRDGDGKQRGDYKLPLADVMDGELKVVPAALSAVLSRLDQTHGPSDSDKDRIRAKVRSYQGRSRSESGALDVVEMTVVGDTSLPIAERGSGPDTSWDSGEAKNKIFEWAGRGKETGIDVGKLSKAFLYRDPDREPEHEWSWKLPIAIPVGGTLTIIPSAVFAASTVINGGRAPVDIPASEKPRILAKVNRLYDRMGVTRWRDRKDVREREAGLTVPVTFAPAGVTQLMVSSEVAVWLDIDGEYRVVVDRHAVQTSCAPEQQLGALCPKCSDEIDCAMTEKIAMAVTQYDEKFIEFPLNEKEQ
jgi:hypothetical protein